MKKTLTVVTLLAGAVAGYSQGQLAFNIDSGSEKQAVYNTQASDATQGTAVSYGGYTVYETLGSSSYQHESPTGTTTYTSAVLSGTGYDAELLIGPAGSTLGQLTVFGGAGQTGGTVQNFNTGAASVGYIIPGGSGITLPTQTGYAAGDTVVVAVAAWNNEGGTVNTLLAAQQADKTNPNSDPWGISNLGSDVLTTTPTTPTGPTGITSFDLGTATPEPSTIALGVMGASALLFRRRK